MQLTTDRLILRPWLAGDRDTFAAMNADPRVMEFFPARLTRAESDAMAERIEADLAAHGFGYWALEAPGEARFIGFTGLRAISFEAPFTPGVEVAWRLAHPHWGRGYASEAARCALRFGFERLGLGEILSMTARINQRSRAVMERIGMVRDEDGDFAHPCVEDGCPLKPHVLYRIRP